MNSRTYSSEGIILARKNYSEADRILIVYSKDHGKVHLLAKGVRYPKSRKRGHLEIFNYFKFQASKGKSLDAVTEAELIDSFRGIRKNLKKVSVAYFLVEMIGRVTREGEKNEKIFQLLLNHLRFLKSYTNLRKLRVNFLEEVLVTLGFWPKDRVLKEPDKVLEDIIERKLSSVRVGKRILA